MATIIVDKSSVSVGRNLRWGLVDIPILYLLPPYK